MNILIISQFYPPDLGAVSFRMEAICKKLKKNGHRVYVLTSLPNRYHDYKTNQKNLFNQFVYRIKLSGKSTSTISRVKGFFEFFFKVLRHRSLYKDKQINLVISTTPYMLEGLAGILVSKYLKSKHILDVRDLWPETPVALGKLKRISLLYFLLKNLEKYLYKNTNQIIVTSEGYINHIKSFNLMNDPVVILNGLDDKFLSLITKKKDKYIPKSENSIRVLYVGNIGIAQNLITLVKASTILNSRKFSFDLIGSGSQIDEIKNLIKVNKINNINIIPPMNRNQLVEHYLSCDLLYLQLNSSVYFSEVIPSKIFEYIATGKPIIYGLNGISKGILCLFEGTFYTEPDNPKRLAEILENIRFKTKYKRDINPILRSSQIEIYFELIKKVVNA